MTNPKHPKQLDAVADSGRSESIAWRQELDAKNAELTALRQRLDERDQEIAQRDAARTRMWAKFGHVPGPDGKCACAYCVGDVEALTEHSGEYEARNFVLETRLGERDQEIEILTLHNELLCVRISQLEPPPSTYSASSTNLMPEVQQGETRRAFEAGMDIDQFQGVNATRGRRWHHGDLSQWSPLEWAGAMCGEAGEAANAAKKLRRLDLELPNREAGLSRTDAEPLRDKLADEVADTIIYGLIILSLLDRTASQVIARVFDKKSVEYGFPERAIPPTDLTSRASEETT